MKAEQKQILVSVINEKITSLKGEVIEKQDAIVKLENTRSELLAGPVKRTTSTTSKKDDEKPTKTRANRKKESKKKAVKKSESNGSKRKKSSSGPDLKGQDAPFKSYYKHVFWNKSQGKWNGQVNNPNEGGPAKLTKSSDNIDECAEFVVQQLGLESIQDIYIEL